MPGKMEGRVGDSPIFGCGAYANHKGACSSTGHGESLIRSTICREVNKIVYHRKPLTVTKYLIISIDYQ